MQAFKVFETGMKDIQVPPGMQAPPKNRPTPERLVAFAGMHGMLGACHVRFTVLSDLPVGTLIGVRGVSALLSLGGRHRVTFSLRHADEWPNCVSYGAPFHHERGLQEAVGRWGNVLAEVRSLLCPNLYGKVESGEQFRVAAEAVGVHEHSVTLYLEADLLTLHTLSDFGEATLRQPRKLDEGMAAVCHHPLLRDYFNGLGFLNMGPDGPPGQVYVDAEEGLTQPQLEDRLRTGERWATHQANSYAVYEGTMRRLYTDQVKKTGNSVKSREQARLAARQVLPLSTSHSILMTASLHEWHRLLAYQFEDYAAQELKALVGEQLGAPKD